jgi:hypothetical protein
VPNLVRRKPWVRATECERANFKVSSINFEINYIEGAWVL